MEEHKQQESLTDAGIKFYGKMIASLSHEIKNVLATINEHAGLLHDLSAMSQEEGSAIDPARVRISAEKIIKQVARGDSIVKTMNRFAHSADQSQQSIDLKDIISFMSVLCQRLFFIKGVTLEVAPIAGSAIIETNLFYLQNLIWLCMDFVIATAGEDKKVRLVVDKAETGIDLRFVQLKRLDNSAGYPFPCEHEQAILDFLDAELSVNKESGEIVVSLKEKTR
ncbi:MAG: hypothetical protein V1753_11935 [Pseudomonadota bacterium]